MELNAAQKVAVHRPLEGQLQIIAGPGTGKTKTLTSRVAHLLIHHQIDPRDVVVMTFTNQAAKEMKSRISSILEKSNKKNLAESVAKNLTIGTFHSICYRYLMRQAKKTGYAKTKGIIDERERTHMISSILQDEKFESFMRSRGYSKETSTGKNLVYAKYGVGVRTQRLQLSSWQIGKFISCKKNGDTHRIEDDVEVSVDEYMEVFNHIFKLYETRQAGIGKADFDDMLVDCKSFLENTPEAVEHVQSILVDEFQDTNRIQLELIYLFAQKHGNVTIVGDPDQSIYKFRGAVPENFVLMQEHYPHCQTVFLEENYRSVAPVLKLSTNVIAQDKQRLGGKDRLLIPSAKGADGQHIKPALHVLDDGIAERSFIESHIRYLLEMSKGALQLSDIAILCRTHNQVKFYGQMRHPVNQLGGRSFWEQEIIVTILSYLHVVNNIEDRYHIEQSISIPSRGLGKMGQRFYLDDGESPLGTTMAERFEHICQANGKKIDGVNLTSSQLKGISDYYQFIKKLKNMIEKDENGFAAVDNVLNEISDLIIDERKAKLCSKYKKTYEELKDDSGAKAIKRDEEAVQTLRAIIQSAGYGSADFVMDEELLANIGYLGYILSTLSLGVEDKKNSKHDALSIGTIHAAKGLEWPIVFVPDLHERNEKDPTEIQEERRVLFVALTRAKWCLNLYFSKKNVAYGRAFPRALSSLLAGSKNHFDEIRNGFNTLSADQIIKGLNLLEREVPKQLKQELTPEKYQKSRKKPGKYQNFTSARSIHGDNHEDSAYGQKRSRIAVSALPNAGFSSASSLLTQAMLEKHNASKMKKQKKNKKD